MARRLPQHTFISIVVAALGLETAPVAAQLEEVIVVARKREESIMKVPVVATALSGEQLEQYAINDMRSIADNVPGLNIGSQVLTSGTQVSLRGIGTSSLNPAVDQSVALNVDGMQMTQGYAYRIAMFDMAQVEVLKGPQALFYGKASPAGVIAVRTADPGEEFDFVIRGGYEFEAEEVLTDLILSGPLSDTLGARLAARYSDSDGNFSNDAVPGSDPFAAALGDPSLGATNPDSRNYDEQEYWLLRGTLLWEPNSRFDGRLKLNYSHNESPASGGNGQLASCPDGTDGLFLDFIGTADCRLDDKNQVASLNPQYFPNIMNGGQPFSEADQFFGTLELNYEVAEDLVLTSVTGYYDIEVEAMINATQTTQFGGAFAANTIHDRDEFTQEFRLTSDHDGSVNYMLGAFYNEGTTDFSTELPFNQLLTALAPPPFNEYRSFGTAAHTIDVEAISLFGQVLWDITPELELGVGARWTDEERNHEVIQSTLVHLGVPPTKVELADPDITASNLSPEITLTYTPTDDLTLFASYKEAFKSGSFDAGGIPADGADTSFDDEEVAGGEAGMKSRWLDGRLAFNAAVYYYDFDDLQVERSDFDAASGQFLTHTVNAASAEVYGVDFDMAYAPETVDGLMLFVAANWNKAEYKDFQDANCWGGQRISDGCNRLYDPRANGGLGGFTAQDLSGEVLLRAPEWAVNYGFDYQTRVFGDKTLVLGVNANYSSKYLMNPLARDDMYQDSYTKVSASIALRGNDDAWEVSLLGDNLTNEVVAGNCGLTDYANAGFFGDTITGGEERGLSGVHEIACQPQRLRSVWLRFTVRPGELLGG